MIIADMEATGLNVHKHSIVSIGALELEDPKNQFYMECRPWEGAVFDGEALAINGFSEEELRDVTKPSLEEMMQEFYTWTQTCKEKTLMGQNVSNDRNFINDALGRAGISWHFSYRTVDLHSVTYFHYQQNGLDVPIENDRTGLNLDAIARYVGIPERESVHDGLMDAKIEAEAYARMLTGKYLLTEFEVYPVPDALKKAAKL